MWRSIAASLLYILFIALIFNGVTCFIVGEGCQIHFSQSLQDVWKGFCDYGSKWQNLQQHFPKIGVIALIRLLPDAVVRSASEHFIIL